MGLNGKVFASDEEENRWTTEQEKDPPLTKLHYRPLLKEASQVVPESISWLWYPYLPLGKLCLLGGDPGMGKTWVALAIAAAYSLGQWPIFDAAKESQHEAGRTIFFGSEDGVEDTLVPRLVALGANLSMIAFAGDKVDWMGRTHRVLLDDRTALSSLIQDAHARLVIFDPFQGFLPHKTEMNKMETVRPVVDSLIQTAKETGCCVLLLGHLNKSKQDVLAYKFLGSVDWFAAARSAMMIVADATQITGRRFYQIKNSLAPKPLGVDFSLVGGSPPLVWGAFTEESAEESVSKEVGKKSRKDRAAEFLAEFLASGEKRSDEIVEAGKKVGLSRNALFEAKEMLGVQARKASFGGQWYWSLSDGSMSDNV